VAIVVKIFWEVIVILLVWTISISLRRTVAGIFLNGYAKYLMTFMITGYTRESGMMYQNARG
jgi:uncharacterized protein YggT (Ycf19 family)